MNSWQSYPLSDMIIESNARLKVDYLGRVCVRGKVYYVDAKFINRPVNVKLTDDICEIREANTNELIIQYKRLVGLELQEDVDWSKYLPSIARHPEHVTSHPIMNCFPRSVSAYVISNPVDIVEKFLHFDF